MASTENQAGRQISNTLNGKHYAYEKMLMPTPNVTLRMSPYQSIYFS